MAFCTDALLVEPSQFLGPRLLDQVVAESLARQVVLALAAVALRRAVHLPEDRGVIVGNLDAVAAQTILRLSISSPLLP